jgi:hypothetical protein
MPRKRSLNLSDFDGCLMDGLIFCRKVYTLFEQTRAAPDGIAKLRLRPTKVEKRLVEELIPIARYVQARYREGRRIKVRWFAGSQPYDAILLSSGVIVDRGYADRKLFVEVTTSVHENEYLARQLMQEQRPVFGVKGISREKKTRAIVSTPYVVTNNEREMDLAAQIIGRLKDKSLKGYAPDTVLIIYCVPNGLTLEPEWQAAIERVRQAQEHHAFREVFLIETSISSFSATLYQEPSRAANRQS